MSTKQNSGGGKNNTMNRYWLFDLAMAVAIAASVGTACRSCLFASLPVDVDGGSSSSPPPGCCDGDDSPAFVEPAEPAFGVGDVVEVYDPSVHASYSFLARVEAVRIDDKVDAVGGCREDAVRYDVVLGFGDEGYFDLAPSSLRPHSPFAPDTPAICENGKSLGAASVPCTVNRAVSSKGKFFGEGREDETRPWLYSVSFEEEGGESITANLPVSRIRRIVGEAPAQGVQAPVASPTNDGAARSLRQEKTPSDADAVVRAEFPVGTVVEMYGEGAYFAFPATVTGHSTRGEDSSVRYELTHGVNRSPMRNVESRFLHPYKIYQEGTEASCNLGKMRKVIMVPCTVIGKADRPNGDNGVIYQVMARGVKADGRVDVEGKERVLFLPMLRVQRVIHDEKSQ